MPGVGPLLGVSTAGVRRRAGRRIAGVPRGLPPLQPRHCTNDPGKGRTLALFLAPPRWCNGAGAGGNRAGVGQSKGLVRTGLAWRTVKVAGGPSVVVVPGTSAAAPPSTLKLPLQVVVSEAV